MKFMMNGVFSGDWMFAGIAAFWIVTAIVHIAFAFAVYVDCGQMQRHLRRNTFLVGGVIWALATLLGGVFVAAIYWLIHHSTLRPRARGTAFETPDSPAAK